MNMIQKFIRFEAAGGILLGIATVFALFVKNSPISWTYDAMLSFPIAVGVSGFGIDKPLILWINDGLMAIFFLLVGLEIKREILEGELSSRDQIALPAFAALGGLAIPALIYSYLNWGDAQAIRGWAVPAATDIAFALGVILLLGKRIPESLKVCLVAIAILDDLVAILIIALFYTENLSVFALLLGLLAVVVLALLNRFRVNHILPYLLAGLFLWVCVLKSGVHATLAGVVVAFFIPLNKSEPLSPLRTLEHQLHPWVSFAILPIFAFANAGVSLQGLSLEVLTNPITLGIVAGLFFGKQIGIMSFTAFCVALKICKLPAGVNWRQYYGMALVTGIGFTMSLFIGTLAFTQEEHLTYVRLGVLVGSALSGLFGCAVLLLTTKPRKQIPM